MPIPSHDLSPLFSGLCTEPTVCHENVCRIIQENVNGIIIVDGSKTVRYANSAAETLLKNTAAALVGKRLVVPPFSGEPGQLTMDTGDGQMLTVEISVIDIRWNREPAWLLSLQDITDRKKYEEQLLNSERQLAEAQKIVHLGSWKRYLDTGRSYWSEEMYRLLGYEPGAIEPSLEAFLERVHPDDRDEVCRLVQAARETRGSIKSYYCRIIRPDGSVRVLLGGGEIIYGPNGEATLAIGTALDITERKLLEEEISHLNAALEKRAAELEAANRELEAFSYTVCHDLRSPLTNINGYCQVLMELCRNKLDQESMRFLEEISKGTERMSQLIDTLLKFSLLAREEIAPVPVNLSHMAVETASELQLENPDRKVEVMIQGGVVATGDERLLRIVIHNLMGNAWKYTGTKETAVIEFGVDEDGRTFFVRDNGVGFPPEDAEKLFLPFQRLQGSEEVSGHGIGLATVHRIIERHGGRIWAEGEPGKGATFFFYL